MTWLGRTLPNQWTTTYQRIKHETELDKETDDSRESEYDNEDEVLPTSNYSKENEWTPLSLSSSQKMGCPGTNLNK